MLVTPTGAVPFDENASIQDLYYGILHQEKLLAEMVQCLTNKHVKQMMEQVQTLGQHSKDFLSQSAKYHYEITKAIAFQDLDPRRLISQEHSTANQPNLMQRTTPSNNL